MRAGALSRRLFAFQGYRRHSLICQTYQSGPCEPFVRACSAA